MAINLHTTYGLNPSDSTYRGERNFLLKVAENNALRLFSEGKPGGSDAGLRVHLDSKGRLAIGYGYDLLANKDIAVEDLTPAGAILTPTQIAAIKNLSGTYTSVPADLAGLTLPSEAAATILLERAVTVREAELGQFFTNNGIVLGKL